MFYFFSLNNYDIIQILEFVLIDLIRLYLRFTFVEVYLLNTDNVKFQGELYIFNTSIFISPTLLSPRFLFAIIEVS